MNNLRAILSFPKNDAIFHEMMNECPEVLLNIELLFENKLAVDKHYHYPKNFIVSCNNILSNVIFFVEFAKKAKSKYLWLYNGISELLEKQNEIYVMLKSLRNSAVHTKLIIPEGAFTFGLYKSLNDSEYRYKIGLGDERVKNNVADSFLYMDTDELFHRFLSFHFLHFIDIDHSVLGECLGITRRWYYDTEYEYSGNKIRKTIDIYESINDFCDHIVNTTRKCFSDNFRLEYSKIPVLNTAKYNFVNTFLEIDLYPNLFNKWWNSNFEPLNFGALIAYRSRKEIDERYKVYERVYEDLPKNLEEYMDRMRRYETIRMQDFVDQEDYNRYVSFISLHHWYINRIFQKELIFRRFDFVLLPKLFELSMEYIREVDLNFDTLPDTNKNRHLREIGNHLEKIRTEIERVLSVGR